MCHTAQGNPGVACLHVSRGNNSDDCVHWSPASANPCINWHPVSLLALCWSILYISPRAHAAHTNTNCSVQTHVQTQSQSLNLSLVSRNLSRIKSRRILFPFPFPVFKTSETAAKGQWLALSDIACDQSEGDFILTGALLRYFSMTAREGENVSMGSSNVPRPLLFVSCVMNKI